jgi:hypothetical protein
LIISSDANHKCERQKPFNGCCAIFALGGKKSAAEEIADKRVSLREKWRASGRATATGCFAGEIEYGGAPPPCRTPILRLFSSRLTLSFAATLAPMKVNERPCSKPLVLRHWMR